MTDMGVPGPWLASNSNTQWQITKRLPSETMMVGAGDNKHRLWY